MRTLWAVTGPPGIGKSTIVSKVIMKLKSRGIIVGGCVTLERKAKGVRTGFELTDLGTGNVGELASVTGRMGPRVGKYRVNLVDLSAIGAVGLRHAAEFAEVIVIDELGPMELVSPDFRRGVRACVDSHKPLMVVIHERLDDDLINEIRESASSIFVLTSENREEVEAKLAGSILDAVEFSRTSEGGRST